MYNFNASTFALSAKAIRNEICDESNYNKIENTCIIIVELLILAVLYGSIFLCCYKRKVKKLKKGDLSPYFRNSTMNHQD